MDLTLARSKPIVLVVDDEQAVRGLLLVVLQQAGYDVVEASNGNEALKICAKMWVALVITDMVMPGKGGMETIQTIRRDFPTVKIIAISGQFGSALDSLRHLGADAVFRKPLDLGGLRHMVQDLIIARPMG